MNSDCHCRQTGGSVANPATELLYVIHMRVYFEQLTGEQQEEHKICVYCRTHGVICVKSMGKKMMVIIQRLLLLWLLLLWQSAAVCGELL